MKHYIKDNVYYIENDMNKVLLSIQLEPIIPETIILQTTKEVYSGPIDLISFNPDINL